MKARFLSIFMVVFAPALMLTWVVSAHGYRPSAETSPTLPTTTPFDVVLIIDASQSQAFDPPSMLAYADRADLACDPASLGVIGQDAGMSTNACVKACNDDPAKPCYPFKTVKDAAKAFVDRLRPGYDRVAVVLIDRQPYVLSSFTASLTSTKQAIDLARVSDHYPGDTPGNPCPYINIGGERWKCTTSNIGGAIRLAQQQLVGSMAQGVVVMLATGSADATDPFPSTDPDSAVFGVCPNKDVQPFCRDNQWTTHHISTSLQYDAEDYGYDRVTGIASGMLGVRLYTVGMGRRVVCTGAVNTYSPGPPVVCVPASGNPFIDPGTGYPNGAEQFLRYAAAAGDDGNPATDPCAGAALGAQCGNYYFTPAASGAAAIYQHIADRLLETVDFSAAPLTGSAPLAVHFADHSVGNILTRIWDFGDAITGTAINPTHTYTSPGSYTVTLHISTTISVSVLTRTNYITVYAPVSAGFSATPITGLRPLTVTFINQTIGDYAHSLWDFGDSLTATVTNPTHTYSMRGSFTVTLSARGPGGTSAVTRTHYITTYEPVSAAFAADPISGAYPLTVTFTNQSSGDYIDLRWNFGDGFTGTVASPKHVYESSGLFTVTLHVSGPGGTDQVIRPALIQVVKPERKLYLPLLVR